MPRYFFHMQFGAETVPDEAGATLPDADAAWDQAKALAASLLRSHAGDPRLFSAVVEVRDEAGEIVLEFPVSEAVSAAGAGAPPRA
ncbi:hypothetical protein V5F77_18240 [Xanthobacter sp. DSM 24535]|uniref:DUF6894 family protein n=1 Tax=Roseixanthobacter psychrophilus TaxID=3119917 RepID=UPI003727292F